MTTTSATPPPPTELAAALRQSRSGFIAVGTFSFFINLLMLSGPLYMMQVYDRVLTGRSISTLVALSVLVGILLLFMGILENVRSRILVRVGSQIDGRLSIPVFEAMLRRRLWRGRNENGQSMNDLRTLREFLSGPGPFAFFDAPWVPIYLGVIFLLHPLLFLVSIIGAAILFGLALLSEKLTRTPLSASSELSSYGTSVADAAARNAESVQAMGMLSGLRQQWLALHQKALWQQRTASDRAGSLTATSKTIRLALQSAILGVGAALAVEQSISAGAMIAASILMGRALAPVDQAIGSWRNFVGARDAYHNLETLLENFPAPPARMALPEAKGHLAAQGIAAGPPTATRALVSGLNFELSAGEALGVIGPSGSGKSVLARLLTGVWHPQMGTIRLDGASLEQWAAEALGRQIGYLPQDVELFDGTVEENISRFTPEADPQAVVAAARAAGIHELILSFPDGYNTRIGERGSNLSGGQRQRLGLARALYKDPILVVLDEPNANLDAEGDQALTTAIQSIKDRGGMVIVMAHRPSAIDAVDKVLFIRAGRQEAFGPKAQVLAAATKNALAAAPNVAQLPSRPETTKDSSDAASDPAAPQQERTAL